MTDTKKFYYLPFLDNLTAVGIAFLMILLFGSWFNNAVFATIATFVMLFTLCGRIYVRMWNLSQKNTRYNWGIKRTDFVKFILPLITFDIVLIILYLLAEADILPLKNVVFTSYYNFPDNAPREAVNITLYNYAMLFFRVWFLYLMYILKNGFVLLLAPVLSFLSAMAGYKLGKENQQIAEKVASVTQIAKDKFNE